MLADDGPVDAAAPEQQVQEEWLQDWDLNFDSKNESAYTVSTDVVSEPLILVVTST